MNKIYTLPEIRSLLTPVFACYGVRCAVLFSSHAKGGTTEHSDTDILSMQIGEMAKMLLSNGAKVQIPSIPWQLLYGIRSRIYMDMPTSIYKSCGLLRQRIFPG